MKNAKERKPHVVYLTRTSMVWGGESLKEPIVINFASDVFLDMEFPNIRSLNNQILTAIEQFNFKPNRVIFVLNQELYFTQQFATVAEDEIKAYLSLVPFDEVISKRLTNPTGQQVIAVSKNLTEPLVEVFTHHGFFVSSILPDIAFGESLKTIEQFTPQVIDTIFPSLVTAESYSFYTPPKMQESMTSIRDSEGHIFNPRLIGMIVFFVVLIIVLLVVLFMNGYFGSSKEEAIKPVAAPVEVVEPTTIPIDVVESSASAELSTESAASASASTVAIQNTIAIEILNGSGAPGQADQVKAALTTAGFTKITTGNSATAGQRTLILYKSTVSATTINAISETLTTFGLANSAQVSPDLTEVDVRIMTAK